MNTNALTRTTERRETALPDDRGRAIAIRVDPARAAPTDVDRGRATASQVKRSRAVSIRGLDPVRRSRVARFAAIGIVSTLAYALLYAVLRTVTSADASNATALIVTAVGNTAANRRFTFGVRGRAGLGRDHATGLVALAIALAVTSAAIRLLAIVAPEAGASVELAVLIGANVVATVIRFAILRWHLDRPRPTPADGPAGSPVDSSPSLADSTLARPRLERTLR